MEDQTQLRAESVEWEGAHYEEPYYAQRTAKIPRKLKRLGILSMPPETRILDACCGRGETLRALQKFGFRNLEGIDGTPQPSGNSTGFQIHHGDVQNMPFSAGSFDLVLNLHSLHHMEDPEGVSRFLTECHRVLKPGGTLGIIDFPASPQILLLFWLLRHRIGTFTGGLRNFARINDEEAGFLPAYLRKWDEVKRVLDRAPFSTIRKRERFFLYYWTMRRQ